jgi:hypothetical protein
MGFNSGFKELRYCQAFVGKTGKLRESYSWRTSATLKLERATPKYYIEKLAIMSRQSLALKNNAALFTASNHYKCIV